MQNTFPSVLSDAGVNGGFLHASNFSSFNSDFDDHPHTDADDISILGTNEVKNGEPMSTARRCCFAASLLLCNVTVAVFFAISCNVTSTCPSQVNRIIIHNWLNNYTRIELKAVINVVDSLRIWEKYLIFLYRGNAFFPEFECTNKSNGIISLIGSSGVVAWFEEMIDEPISIDCTLLDVDRNGTPDCLVIDEYGNLGAINPISGQWHWKFKLKSEHKMNALDFPVILPDLDGDGILDILIATSASQERRKNFIPRGGSNLDFDWYIGRNYLFIISGRLGKSIGEGYKINDCDSLRKFQFEKTHLITFNCMRNNTEVQRCKTLAELFALITNKPVGQTLTPLSEISQYHHNEQRKETEAQRNIYYLNGRELVVENCGKCPHDCNVSFVLRESKNGKVNILRNFTCSRMYGMIPAQWHFKNSKSKLCGFVMKFWTWNQIVNESLDYQERQQYKSNDKNAYVPDKFKGIDWSIADIAKRYITETVFLVIFNGSDTHIKNTSQSSIIQLCHHDFNEVFCQPDVNNQENSLLVADLDQDGAQEIVSYYSTFVRNKEEGKDWKLVTFVKLLRLDSELRL